MFRTGTPCTLHSGTLHSIVHIVRSMPVRQPPHPSSTTCHNHMPRAVQEVRKNMHIVLSFSPVGDAFRERLRMFPSLVNCTTIDWFTRWPTDALATVAKSFLSNLVGADTHTYTYIFEYNASFLYYF
jgi:dynein heavy chain